LAKAAAQSFFHHAVDAGAGEHRTAFDIDRAHRKAEQHDAQDEPRRRLAHHLLGDASGIEGRGA